jgi:DNA-nicking Smr family endonuclease
VSEKTGRPSRQSNRRRLSPEEEHLWSTVTRGIKPLRRATLLGAAKGSGVASGLGQDTTAIPAAGAGLARLATQVAMPAQKQAQPHPGPIAIARRDRLNLSRGRTQIDARIDLHGLTQTEAHAALLRFLQRCRADGARFALVITGKGAPNGERGVLRRQVPLWLGLGEFRAHVLGFDVAGIGHGGEGAFYVRLRSLRRWPQSQP